MILQELHDYIKTVQTFDKDAGQDATVLHQYLIQLTNFMARANGLMAEYGKKARDQKKVAYQNLFLSMQSQKKMFSPMLAKDYVDSQCSEVLEVYDTAERLSRLCTHTIDAVRTIISSLKSERQFSYS